MEILNLGCGTNSSVLRHVPHMGNPHASPGRGTAGMYYRHLRADLSIRFQPVRHAKTTYGILSLRFGTTFVDQRRNDATP